MAVMSGIVLFTVIWSMVFMILLPVRVQTQGDLGQIVEGTHAGAPEHHHLKKKALWTTAVSIVLWAIIAGIILSGWFTVADVEATCALVKELGGTVTNPPALSSDKRVCVAYGHDVDGVLIELVEELS